MLKFLLTLLIRQIILDLLQRCEAIISCVCYYDNTYINMININLAKSRVKYFVKNCLIIIIFFIKII